MNRMIELILDDNRGIYIPQNFAELLCREYIVSGISEDQLDYLRRGPDAENYWEVWESVLNHGVIRLMGDQTEWRLHQDGDLWAYRADIDTESEEYKNLFGEEC